MDQARAVAHFWARVDRRVGCWIWTAARSTAGYGRVHWSGRLLQAHRVAYELAIGPIPDGMQLDHLCRNRACVRPNHLEAVTRRENLRRGYSPLAINARKTHCPKGHELTEANTYRSKMGRQCRRCRTEVSARQAVEQRIARQADAARSTTCKVCSTRFEYTRRPGRHEICSDDCRLTARRRAAREYAARRRAAA